MRTRFCRLEERRGTGSEETDHHTGRHRRIAVGTAGTHIHGAGYDPGVLPRGDGIGHSAALCPGSQPGRDEGDDEEAKIDYSLESILPVSNLPDSPEEADQIIFVDSAWTFSGTNNGIDVYDCKTNISLYDAETLQSLGLIGTAVNTLSGFVMVSGDSYYPPVPIEDVKKEIMNWIERAPEDETEG